MFTSARLKLTAWYLSVIMLISLSFSLIIYRLVGMEIERFIRSPRFRIQNQMEQGIMPMPGLYLLDNTQTNELVAETKKRLLVNLVFVNGGILVLSGALGFMLAGRTLRPIALMIDEQNRFVSDASHELKTPLTSLKTAFEVFLRDKNSTLKDAKSLISESVHEVDKLAVLSNSLLELARFKKLPPLKNFQSVSLSHVVSKAVSRLRPLALKKNLTISTDFKDLFVLGDPEKLTDLVVILLDNAIKYSQPKKEIKIKVFRFKKNIILKIIDQGIGISKKDLPHIFDRFYRSDSARTKDGRGGFGLGLAIAKEIVDIHQARIQVDSRLHKGSTFSVIFQG